MNRRAAVLLVSLFASAAGSAASLNEVAVDVPVDGGVVASFSKQWRLFPHLDAGFMIGGGRVERDFDLDGPGGTLEARTEALILPMAGPKATVRLSPLPLAFSVAFLVYRAETDVEIDGPAGAGTFTGSRSFWGTALYSPLITLDFYDKARDLYFGFGLGGFLGLGNPDLTARRGGSSITTGASPLEGLTVHVRTRWAPRAPRQPEEF